MHILIRALVLSPPAVALAGLGAALRALQVRLVLNDAEAKS